MCISRQFGYTFSMKLDSIVTSQFKEKKFPNDGNLYRELNRSIFTLLIYRSFFFLQHSTASSNSCQYEHWTLKKDDTALENEGTTLEDDDATFGYDALASDSPIKVRKDFQKE